MSIYGKKFITHRKKISMDNEQNNSIWTFGFAKKFFFLKFADITLERNLVEWRVFLRASVKTFTTDHANSGQHEKINYVRAGLGVTAFIRKSFCHRSLSRAILSRPELENVRSQAAI